MSITKNKISTVGGLKSSRKIFLTIKNNIRRKSRVKKVICICNKIYITFFYLIYEEISTVFTVKIVEMGKAKVKGIAKVTVNMTETAVNLYEDNRRFRGKKLFNFENVVYAIDKKKSAQTPVKLYDFVSLKER